MNRLQEILKEKGVGPKGSKHLSIDELNELSSIINEDSASAVTRATLITAFVMLKNNKIEQNWLDEYLSKPSIFEDVIFFQGNAKQSDYNSNLTKIISEDNLQYDDAYAMLTQSLNGDVPEWATAIFLQSMRLKRETPVENVAFWDSMQDLCGVDTVKLPLVLDIADSYDGCNRTESYTPFIAAFLAELGIPTVIHDVENLAPKFGVTSYKILNVSKKEFVFSKEKAIAKLLDKDIHWCYLNRAEYNSKLNSYNQLREEMVKRPFLATFEKLLMPIRAEKNYLITGYTHPPYKKKLSDLFFEKEYFESVLLMKGVEGSSQISMGKTTDYTVINSEITSDVVEPHDYGFDEIPVQANRELVAIDSYNAGYAAISGKDNMAREFILYFTMFIIDKLGLERYNYSKHALEEILSSGKVAERFDRFFE